MAAKNSKGTSDALAALAKVLAADVVVSESPDELKAARMAKTNNDGGMLMCDFTLAKRPGQPDPLCVTIVDQHYWIKRGAKIKLPWYVVESFLHNVERKYRQEKDAQGKNVVVFDDMTTEQFQHREINPAINPATDEPFMCEGPKTAPTQQPY